MQYTEIHWSLQSAFPLLTLLQFTPLAVMALVLAQPTARAGLRIALAGAALEFFLACYLYTSFELQQASWQFAEFSSLFDPLAYHAAVDGVSVLFMLLSALLTLLVLIYGLTLTDPLEKHELGAILIIQSTLMTQFTSLNMLWFLFASMLQLALMGYLLKKRSTAAETDRTLSRYFLFMSTSLLLLLTGILLLGWNHAQIHGTWQFHLFDLADTEIPGGLRSIIFFLLFLGLAVRIPLLPLHGWFPPLAEHSAAVIGTVLLIGLKVSVFALVRFVFPLLPEAVIQWQTPIMVFAVASVLYAVMLVLKQVNLQRLLAFVIVSHSSIIIVGLFSLEHSALQGSILLAVQFGLAAAGLYFLTGMIQRRTHTLLLGRLGGLLHSMPQIGMGFLLAVLSMAGLPGTPGYEAAHLMFEGVIQRFGALPGILALLGHLVTVGFLLFVFLRVLPSTGVKHEPQSKAQETLAAEYLILGILVLVLLLGGYYSAPWAELTDASMQSLGTLFMHH